jgi:hypothetical protein
MSFIFIVVLRIRKCLTLKNVSAVKGLKTNVIMVPQIDFKASVNTNIYVVSKTAARFRA